MLSAHSINAFFAISRLRDGCTTSPQGLLCGLRKQALFGTHFLRAPVLVFQLFDPLHQRRVHTAVLSPPPIKYRATHAAFMAEGWPAFASFGFADI